MKNIIGETIRPNGAKVQIGQSGSMFLVKDYYPDGGQRDVKYFEVYNSAVACFNKIVDQENTQGGK